MHSKGIETLYVVEDFSNDTAQWEHGLDLLAAASRLNPVNADYVFDQADFSKPLTVANTSRTDSLSNHENPAYGLYRRALSIRPHSGFIWAEYASSLFENGKETQEVMHALEIALALAPQQASVNYVELQIGFAWWDRLDEEQQLHLQSTVQSLLRLRPRYVIDAAISSNWFDNLRPLLLREIDIRYLDHAIAEKVKHNSVDP